MCGEGEGDGSAAPSLSALDAERCGLAEALGIISPTGEGIGADGGDGGGLGVSLVEWADRLGRGPATSSSSSSSSSSSASSTPLSLSSSSAAAGGAPFLLPNDRVLEVAIEPLPAERARELSARHPRLSSSGGEGEGEEEEEEEELFDDEEMDEEEEFDEFADTRWRLVTLRPRGPRAREAAEEAARALRELNAGRETVAIEEEEEEEEG